MAFVKVLNDYAETKDNLTINDGATYAQILVKKETANGFEGPSYSDESGYAIDYFDGKYTELFAPIISTIKVLKDSLSSYLDRPFKGFTKILSSTASALDYLDIADRSTFADIKVLKDYQTVQVDGIKQKTLDKVLKDYAYAIDDGLAVFKPMTLDPGQAQRLRPLDQSSFNAQKPQKETLFAGDVLLPFTIVKRLFESPRAVEGPNRKDLEFYVPDYGDSQYLIDFALTVSISKVLRDSARALDYIDIADRSTFTSAKIFREEKFVTDSSVRSFNKAFNDIAYSIDNININDGATYAQSLLKKEIPVGIEGPSYSNESGYATDYFADKYTELFAPIISTIKILKDFLSSYLDRPFKGFTKIVNDIAYSIDNITIADGATYSQALAKKETAAGREGPSYENAAGYAVDYFADPYTELFAPIKSINKVLKDYQITKDGDFKDLEFYVPGYGEQTYLYDSFLAKSVTTIKRDYASKYKETGFISYWNYTTTSGGEVFFATDYVGSTETFSS
jgi:hypothetical protein